MKLDLRPIVNAPGTKTDFRLSLDLSGFPWEGAPPVREPVEVRGAVRNHAGALVLEAELSAELFLTCDRCAKEFQRDKRVRYETLLADHLEDEDSDDIVLLDKDGGLDLDEQMTDVFVLSLDTKNLCKEDCRGLCPGCGADLNTESCRCKKQTDPRLAGLAKFFDP